MVTVLTAEAQNLANLLNETSYPKRDRSKPSLNDRIPQTQRGNNEVFTQSLDPADLSLYADSRALNQEALKDPLLDGFQELIANFFGKKAKVEIPNSHSLAAGVSDTLMTPAGENYYENAHLQTWRLRNKQGVLTNPRADRRTTFKSFHVGKPAKGKGIAISDDKVAVPNIAALNLLKAALNPPDKDLELPYTANMPEDKKAKGFYSLNLDVTVRPGVAGVLAKKNMAARVMVPGSMMSIARFCEGVFQNAGQNGDPFLQPELTPENNSGCSTLLIAAPHLTKIRKKDLGYPLKSAATRKQIKEGFFYEDEEELYNNGKPFKLCLRDGSGRSINIIADAYPGYFKKTIKSEVSMAANLIGAEEEHSGDALVARKSSQGTQFTPSSVYTAGEKAFPLNKQLELLGDQVIRDKNGVFTLKEDPNIVILPFNSDFTFNRNKRAITFSYPEEDSKTIRFEPSKTYLMPNGAAVKVEKDPKTKYWRITLTDSRIDLMHKESTVSGGGKSELAKSLHDCIEVQEFTTTNYNALISEAKKVLEYDFRNITRAKDPRSARPILSPERGLGSVVKLLTPSPEYTEAYNSWLETITPDCKQFIFNLKARWNESLEEPWENLFSSSVVSGSQKYTVQFRDEPVKIRYLRVGYDKNKTKRLVPLRPDFVPAQKLAQGDDLTASVTIPLMDGRSVKVLVDFEGRHFQRPDAAINAGDDEKTEKDLATLEGLLITNFEPCTPQMAMDIMMNPHKFEQYTPEMQKFIEDFATNGKDGEFAVISSELRMVPDDKDPKKMVPTANPRYQEALQEDEQPRTLKLFRLQAALHRKCRPEDVVFHVTDTIPGHRLNGPDKIGNKVIRPMAAHGPIHKLDLPKYLMNSVASLTGKSPSTTGAGSEGALTKGPFNSMPGVIDLNDHMVSLALQNQDIFITAAGKLGPEYNIGHDVSMLIPEIFTRMTEQEKDTEYLLSNGYIEKVPQISTDPDLNTDILGYRITKKFMIHFGGRIVTNPEQLFDEKMLKPEVQDMNVFMESLRNINENYKIAAEKYINDGTIELAEPPIKALLYIMARGSYTLLDTDQGREITIDAKSPEFLKMFSREAVISSPWYKDRLKRQAFKEYGDLTFASSNFEKLMEGILHKAFYTSDLTFKRKVDDQRNWLKTERERLEKLIKGDCEGLKGFAGLSRIYEEQVA